VNTKLFSKKFNCLVVKTIHKPRSSNSEINDSTKKTLLQSAKGSFPENLPENMLLLVFFYNII